MEIPNSEDRMRSQERLGNRNGNTSINSEVQQNESDSVQFDDILNHIGEFGPWQRAIYFLSCFFVLIPSGLHTAGVPFITGTPKFQCATPKVECEVNKCCKNCTKYAFIGPYAYNSTVTEAASGAGMLVGSFIFGAVSDNFGRRSCMLLCSVLMTLFSLGASFSKSLVLFLRFCTGACLTGFFVAHYVYILELVGPTFRTMSSKCSGFFWAAGSGAIALMAYYIRDWRTLLLVSSCPPALFLLLWL
ncbi:organic cation transporter protein-like isoform X2 [Stylophora pistillata]|uniref:organic cation transporter protein-like isoform X2 n=1 Tax=Stylophora pistillata TaxID=50429 RepID=UPI000C047866|nr:organic cation transporter protein-like isoform X2 [Stylophora pistillata]